MKTIEARYRIVTPMFIGGADSTPSDGIRPPSFKGALRFWWRALNWGKYQNLAMLHKKEAELFGSTVKTVDKKQVGGQGVFLINLSSTLRSSPKFSPKAGHQYLLGQGLYHFKKGLLREYISDGEIIVRVAFKPNKDAGQLKKNMDSIREAMILLGYLGGLGSRARKGFGSLSIMSLMSNGVAYNIPNNKAAFKELFGRVINKCKTDLPPYSAFSGKSRVDISNEGKNALELLHVTGQELQMYRGYGRSNNKGGEHKINGVKAEQNFAADHDLMDAFIKNNRADKHPERVVFGLPHNYFFSSTMKGADIVASGKHRTRRASPLFIHMHQFSDGNICVVQALLASQFLPAADKVHMKSTKSRSEAFIEPQENWDVIHNYVSFQKTVASCIFLLARC